LQTSALAESEMYDQLPDDTSISPVPIRVRIVAGVSFAPVANGVFLLQASKRHFSLELN